MGCWLAIGNATEQVAAGLRWKKGAARHAHLEPRPGLWQPVGTAGMGPAAPPVNAREMLKEKLMGKGPITKKGVAEAGEWKKRERAGTVQEEIGGREVIDVRAAWTAWRCQRADCEEEEGVQQARREVELVGPIGNSAWVPPGQGSRFPPISLLKRAPSPPCK